MTRWSIDEARAQFGELFRRAVAGEAQRVITDGSDAVVVLNAAEYDRVAGPVDLLTFLQRSPLAEAAAAGEWTGDRPRDLGRDIDLGE